jgi:hypothetical protein
MNWIDKILERLTQPRDFTWPGIIVLILTIVGLCALLASVLR